MRFFMSFARAHVPNDRKMSNQIVGSVFLMLGIRFGMD